jgi:uncharacterized membrane protein
MPAVPAQEFTTEVSAAPLDCFKAVVDFDAYPSWSSPIEKVKVLERDRAGIGRVVEFHANMKVRTVRYVLEYEYQKPGELTWHSVDGDVASIEGSYHFVKRDAKTDVTCRQAIDLGFWVPGTLRNLAERTALRQSVLEFKEEVERRIAAKHSGGRTRKRKS